MSKNVAVFVDVANIFFAAKAAGVDIDYVTLLKSASAGRDLVRAYAYTGLDPENENQRNFHDFLRRHGYKVVSKDIRLGGSQSLQLRLEMFNIANRLNYENPAANLPDGTAGVPFTNAQAGTVGYMLGPLNRTVGLGTARQTQLSIRYAF